MRNCWDIDTDDDVRTLSRMKDRQLVLPFFRDVGQLFSCKESLESGIRK